MEAASCPCGTLNRMRLPSPLRFDPLQPISALAVLLHPAASDSSSPSRSPQAQTHTHTSPPLFSTSYTEPGNEGPRGCSPFLALSGVGRTGSEWTAQYQLDVSVSSPLDALASAYSACSQGIYVVGASSSSSSAANATGSSLASASFSVLEGHNDGGLIGQIEYDDDDDDDDQEGEGEDYDDADSARLFERSLMVCLPFWYCYRSPGLTPRLMHAGEARAEVQEGIQVQQEAGQVQEERRRIERHRPAGVGVRRGVSAAGVGPALRMRPCPPAFRLYPIDPRRLYTRVPMLRKVQRLGDSLQLRSRASQ